MNREEVKEDLLEISKSKNNILVELPTGFGKTKIALELVKNNINKHNTKVLIVVPRNVLKEEWNKEIIKWHMNKNNISYTYTTYVSLPKYANEWDFVLFDEAHHLSERCRESLKEFTIKRAILLSATVNSNLKDEISDLFDNLYLYKVQMKDAIEDNVLPDPKVFLIPLTLSNDIPTEVIYKNPKGKEPVIECNWANRWQYIKQKKFKVRIYCTQKQYLEDLNGQIEWYKRKAMHNQLFKNRWLKLCGDRLKWLSNIKNPFINTLLDKFKDERTLVFCSSIEQTEVLGKYCINSKNKESISNLNKFNSGKINHITACNMLNEGMNLTNCKIGIYANLNSSETIIKQRLGRILRDKNPVIVIPFYKNTREQELVEKMIEDYNPELVNNIYDTKNLTL